MSLDPTNGAMAQIMSSPAGIWVRGFRNIPYFVIGAILTSVWLELTTRARLPDLLIGLGVFTIWPTCFFLSRRMFRDWLFRKSHGFTIVSTTWPVSVTIQQRGPKMTSEAAAKEITAQGDAAIKWTFGAFAALIAVLAIVYYGTMVTPKIQPVAVVPRVDIENQRRDQAVRDEQRAQQNRQRQEADRLNQIRREARAQPPRLISPPDGTIYSHFPRTFVLKWSPIEGVSEYLLEQQCYYEPERRWWSQDTEEIMPCYSPRQVSGEAIERHHGGAGGHRWRIRAVFPDGRYGPFSEWRTIVWKN